MADAQDIVPLAVLECNTQPRSPVTHEPSAHFVVAPREATACDVGTKRKRREGAASAKSKRHEGASAPQAPPNLTPVSPLAVAPKRLPPTRRRASPDVVAQEAKRRVSAASGGGPTCAKCLASVKLVSIDTLRNRALKAEVTVASPLLSSSGDVGSMGAPSLSTASATEERADDLIDGTTDHIRAAPTANSKPRPPPPLPQTVACPGCHRIFHKRCYLEHSSVEVRFDAVCVGGSTVDADFAGCTFTASAPCVVCLSGVVPEVQLRSESSVAGQGATADDGTVSSLDDLAALHCRQLLRDGFTVVPLTSGCDSNGDDDGLMTRLSALGERVVKHHTALMSAYDIELESGRSVPSLAHGFANFRERGEGRYEITRTPFIEQALLPIVEESLLVQRVLRSALHCDADSDAAAGLPQRMSSGCFLALPGAKAQNLHTDGPALCASANLHPYAINVFVPLVDVGPHNGTEFFPGTHLQRPANVSSGESEADVAAPLPPPSAPPAPLTPTLSSTAGAGSGMGVASASAAVKNIEDLVAGRQKVSPNIRVGHALLFDYRVVHRGLGNRGSAPRPNCYITYSQPWYRDVFNFGHGRYGKELVVPEYLLQSRGERLQHRRENAGIN